MTILKNAPSFRAIFSAMRKIIVFVICLFILVWSLAYVKRAIDLNYLHNVHQFISYRNSDKYTGKCLFPNSVLKRRKIICLGYCSKAESI